VANGPFTVRAMGERIARAGGPPFEPLEDERRRRGEQRQNCQGERHFI